MSYVRSCGGLVTAPPPHLHPTNPQVYRVTLRMTKSTLECVVDGVSSQIPMHRANVANSMADGRMKDRWTDLLSHTFTMKGSHVASFDKFRPVVWEEIE